MKCLNCNETLVGNYCMHCGQVATATKINNKYLFKEMPEAVFNLQHGFWYTLWQIVKNPVKVAKDYINGRRVGYYKPISLLLLIVSFYFLIFRLVMPKSAYISKISKMGANYSGSTTQIEGQSMVYDSMFSHPILIYVITLPVFSYAFYLAFKKYKYSYGEHFYASVIFMSFNMLVTSIPLLGVTYLWGFEVSAVVSMLFSPAYILFYYYFLKAQGLSFFEAILRTVWAGVLFLVFTLLLVTLIAVPSGIIYAKFFAG